MTNGCPLTITWGDLSEKTLELMPWWIGCHHASKSGRTYYWCPVEDMTQDNICRTFDIDRWLDDTPYSDVLINLGDGRLPLFDAGAVHASSRFGSIVYDLAIDELPAGANSLLDIQSTLEQACIQALHEVGDRMRIGSPPLRTRNAGTSLPTRSIAEIADEVDSDDVLVFIAARYAQRGRLDAVRASLRPAVSSTSRTWVPFTLNASRRSAADLSVQLDFSELPSPINPDVLGTDPQNVLLVVAPKLDSLGEQHEFLAGAMAQLREFLPLHAKVAGTDGGRRWLVTSFDRARSASR